MYMNPSERQQMYQQHRMRVLNAKSMVNSQPPPRKVKDDSCKKELSYIEMMASLSRKTSTRTFTRSPEPAERRTRSVINTRIMRRGDSRCVRNKSHQDITPRSAKSRDRKKKNFSSAIPDHVVKRYESLSVTSDAGMLRRLLRPRIYLDLEVKDVRPLGRLVIQLFTEACPEVVLQFVRACTAQNRSRFNLTRLFPPLWFEGKLSLDDSKALTLPNIEHDTSVLDHGCGAGVLSFPSRYVRGSKRRFLTFSISFKPLDVLNGKRIAFGKVRRGAWILDVIQDFSTKNGKPIKELIVKQCGMVR